MFDDDFDNERDDQQALNNENGQLVDDIFASSSDDVPGDVDDPFATLDQEDEDDFFARLQASDEDFGEELFEAERPRVATATAEERLPTLPDVAVPEWLHEIGIEGDEIVEQQHEEAEEEDAEADEALVALAGTGPQGIAFGMTAQQRMVLAIFLFLDVSVLGFLLLYVLGVISF